MTLSDGLPVLFLVMFLKEAGLPLPIPGDVLMLGAAARAASGAWSLPAVVLVFEVSMVAGGSIQFLLARGPGRRLLFRAGRLVGLTPARLDRAAAPLRRGGATAVALGMITPGLRAVTLAASGIADLPLRVVFPALLIGDSVFFALHVAIGYAGGAGLSALIHGSHIAFIPLLLAVLIALALLGSAGWLALTRISRMQTTQQLQTAQGVGGWQEGACPACLAIAVARSAVISGRDVR